MKTIPFTPGAYKLFHEGAIALAQVEANGMAVDVPYIKRSIKQTLHKIKRKRAKIQNDEVVKLWKRHFRDKTNLNSHEQLGKVLFELMGFKSTIKTKSGGYSTSEEALAGIDHPFVKRFLLIQKLEKAKNYLLGIDREVVDTVLRPSFNLNMAVTFRSSSDSPNFQNLPVRTAWMRKLIRSVIKARKGRRIVELDYKGVEVCGAACYNRDPVLMKYIKDKSKDMHRDMAVELYKLKPEQVSKEIRHAAKNKFVFPQFYGSWYLNCARDLWNAIDRQDLKTEDGIPLKEHLAKHGITELGACIAGRDPRPGSFEEHVKKVEKRFWGTRFAVYAEWKRKWYDLYKKQGFITSKTGFVFQGLMNRKEVINYPVQGASFHCLLWSLVELQKEITKRGMKTLLIGQIHDSIEADVPDEELDEFLILAHEIMTVRIRKHWKWIIVPLEIEAEVTPIGGNWEEKKKWKIPVRRRKRSGGSSRSRPSSQTRSQPAR